MNGPIVLLVIFNLAALATLSRHVGEFDRTWWLRATPFFLCAIGLSVEAVAVPLVVASIGMIVLTITTNQVALASRHPAGVASQVTRGARPTIRRLFDPSSLLALAAAAVTFPHPCTVHAARVRP